MNFLMETLFAANKYFNDQEPWNKKNDPDRLNTIIYVSLELIRKISILMYPIIPETSLKALNIFNIKEKDIIFNSLINNEFLKQGMKINKINILIKKIIND
jgi:methionyl-tRNA synthetase